MVAINPGSLESHKQWADEFTFGFPICVDQGQKVAIAYGATKPEGGIKRCVVLVNKQGRVAWAKEGMPETDEILAAIDALSTDDPGSSRLSSS